MPAMVSTAGDTLILISTVLLIVLFGLMQKLFSESNFPRRQFNSI